nr:hypothetical protein BgiMline_008517 [Biomphalaria glabrata]
MKSWTPMGDVLRYPIISLTLGGCFYVLKNSKETWLRFQESRRHRVIIVCVSVVAAIIQLTSVLRCIAFLVHFAPNFNNLVSYFMQAYLYILYGSVVYVFESVMCHLYYNPVMEELKKYEEEYGFCNGLVCLKKQSLIFTWLLKVCITINVSVYFVGSYLEDDVYLSFPFDGANIMLVCLIGFCNAMVLLPISSFMILYSALIKIVIAEFYDTSSEMKRVMLLVAQPDEMEQNFRKVRSRHQSLCLIVTKLSQLTRLNGSVGLLFNVAIMFFALYALGSEQLSRMYVLLEILGIAWTLLSILSICIIWGRLPSAAHSIVDSIGLSSASGISQDLMQQLQLFVVCCSSKRIGIDLFGLFTLDSHTFLMVIGTIVTYGIVVIQFQHDKSRSPLNVSSTTVF